MEAAEEEIIDIAIVGAGICGLATALALHRKGIQSVVLERSETLRDSGAAIGILTNGWCALDQLGVGHKLRSTALPLQGIRDIWLDSNKQREAPVSKGEARCVKRSELMNTLGDGLPQGTIRFGCRIRCVKEDPCTNFPTLEFLDGSTIKAKILIGCDGASSVVAEYLKLKEKKVFGAWAVRGLTYYPNSEHGFPPQFSRYHGNNVVCGRSPINHNLVFWFLLIPGYNVPQDLIKRMTVQKITNGSTTFPNEIVGMIRDCDMASLSLTHLRYRPAWEVLLEKFRKGTITVAGDAMHVMGPFLGQGGSAALEDAVVLARCLAQKINDHDHDTKKIEEAMDLYVKERRMRLVRLSAQSYLTGLLLSSSASSLLRKLSLVLIMLVIFHDPLSHTLYDCGPL
ncbi:monooxygenase 1-like isoform X2 [Humulus lupulus]|uniref:monooxygenase 1-like isoform X2 n=1 Tax=Humulus lupulus TaxID=3486 RepID=UPI002B4128BD|nr:monooxygenase 1-like isoform X2 [Humulus lupulus]